MLVCTGLVAHLVAMLILRWPVVIAALLAALLATIVVPGARVAPAAWHHGSSPRSSQS